VNSYYDIATDFYEYGWGASFHFAPRHSYESFNESIVRHEYWLAAQMGLKKGHRVLDVGCGVGGPMRNIARFSQATIVGLNNNDYQLERVAKLNAKEKLDHLCSGRKGNFMDIDLEAESFDMVYAIEATCHAPDRSKCFAEIFKVLKPGGTFAGYEWVTTDAFNKEDAEHKEIMHMIEYGNGLPELTPASDVVKALESAGFEIECTIDLAAEADARSNDVPWYEVMIGGWAPSQWKVSRPGTWVTHHMVSWLEYLGVAAKGTLAAHEILIQAKEGLIRGGQKNLFTPMLFFKATKPLKQVKA